MYWDYYIVLSLMKEYLLTHWPLGDFNNIYDE